MWFVVTRNFNHYRTAHVAKLCDLADVAKILNFIYKKALFHVDSGKGNGVCDTLRVVS